MKYVQFTYVDAQTGVPVSIAPAANGPSIPDGVVPTFDIESSRTQQSPVVYGFVEKGEIPECALEVEKDVFFDTFKTELKQRAIGKRKQVERGGIVFNDVLISTTENGQNRLNNTLSAMDRDDTIKSLDYEISQGQFHTFTREEIYQIGKEVNKHVQQCFSDCRTLTEKIDSLKLSIKTLDKVFPILEQINSFGVKEKDNG